MTGAGSGIGRSVALALVGAGWSVVAAGRRPGPLAETAALAEAAAPTAGPTPAAEGRGRVLAVPTDVTSAAEVDALFAAACRDFGRVDLLFNNAGVSGPPGVPFEEIAPEQWRRVVDTNLTGTFLCAQAAFRVMRRQSPQGGRIINNGSISAHVPRPHSAPYTATKHAVTGLTKSLSLDGRAFGIACGQIDIGNAATDMTRRMEAGVPQADGTVAAEPVMDVADVARTVLHMAELPLEANIPFVTVMATNMPYIGRG
ncbi:SDR family oxidoreductase [Streptomyces clavuligerus]|uniref:Putative dehydrogenase n=1 Tax=Streptomyces clavuligerus TaxID=1901 RepID=B5GZ70_STRCL|nr:SDR family oxidoreductase [Streptomyces clavuligerus]ANW20441.1 3-oxoacyl-ACP reductase [Streptomyces clavuligerus]AXU15067.1 SDR family oxidoreductase [Streptomyces clavuligerus]EDY51616.1 dehydrogenase [Streptomyces clavuligerus]EFG06586.1 putative dehydrogenase [Streptomyces clavuligerus]MBY6305126.1 SDR family oxidoreductase [Streptomyces clavuligerus]